MPDVGGALTRKLGPLPAWAWGAVIGGGYLGYRVLTGGGLSLGGGSSTPTIGGTTSDLGQGTGTGGSGGSSSGGDTSGTQPNPAPTPTPTDPFSALIAGAKSTFSSGLAAFLGGSLTKAQYQAQVKQATTAETGAYAYLESQSPGNLALQLQDAQDALQRDYARYQAGLITLATYNADKAKSEALIGQLQAALGAGSGAQTSAGSALPASTPTAAVLQGNGSGPAQSPAVAVSSIPLVSRAGLPEGFGFRTVPGTATIQALSPVARLRPPISIPTPSSPPQAAPAVQGVTGAARGLAARLGRPARPAATVANLPRPAAPTITPVTTPAARVPTRI